MSYTLSQAALAIGRDRSTLQKAIRRGTLSAHRDAATGAWRVDAAELERVYGLGTAQTDSAPRPPGSEPDVHLQLAVERMKTTGLEARLADMERVNDDLRRQLDI